MPVIFDASFLIPLLDPKVKGEGEIDARLDFLFQTLDKARVKIIVPTPALCEVLIGAGDAAPQYLDIINRSARFKIAPFAARGRPSRRQRRIVRRCVRATRERARSRDRR